MFMSPPETLSGESKLEQAKLEAKEALAKQVKISLEFEIEKVGASLFRATWCKYPVSII